MEIWIRLKHEGVKISPSSVLRIFKRNGEYVDIVELEVEHAIGTKMRSPLVCSAMRKDYGCRTEVLVDTASHNSTTHTVGILLSKRKIIKYSLRRGYFIFINKNTNLILKKRLRNYILDKTGLKYYCLIRKEIN